VAPAWGSRDAGRTSSRRRRTRQSGTARGSHDGVGELGSPGRRHLCGSTATAAPVVRRSHCCRRRRRRCPRCPRVARQRSPHGAQRCGECRFRAERDPVVTDEAELSAASALAAVGRSNTSPAGAAIGPGRPPRGCGRGRRPGGLMHARHYSADERARNQVMVTWPQFSAKVAGAGTQGSPFRTGQCCGGPEVPAATGRPACRRGSPDQRMHVAGATDGACCRADRPRDRCRRADLAVGAVDLPPTPSQGVFNVAVRPCEASSP
jgi:hypothetical protein